jgi:hypothetical protein
MKKILFKIEVLSLVAMFPLYVFLEMNHESKRSPENNNYPGFTEKVEKSNFQASVNTNAQNENTVPITIKKFLY